MHPLYCLTGPISILESFSSYAVVYIGITGDPFVLSARRAKDLVQQTKGKGRDGRKRRRIGRPTDYALLAHLLTLSSLSLAAVSAIGGYIFAAHTLSGPTNAPLAALLCGAVTYLTVRFGIGLAEDAADALFLCYRLDLDAETPHRKDVFEVFEGQRDSMPGV
jgi:hypothetical protein